MDETNVAAMPPPLGAPDGDLHPVLVELFAASSRSDDGSNKDRSDVVGGDASEGNGGPSSSAKQPVAGDHRVSPLQVLNYVLRTSQVSPDAVRRAHGMLSSSSSSSSSRPAATKESADEGGGAGRGAGGGERLGDVMARDDPNKKQDEESPPMSRRQRKKLLRQSKDAATAAAAAAGTPESSSLNFERHVALRVYYDGETYSGLAENVGRDDDRSIEKSLFRALVQARLVTSRETCRYSRSGRTDRGVSAAGQIVALRLKSAFKSNMQLLMASRTDEEGGPNGTRPIREDDLPPNSFDELRVLCPPRNPSMGSDRDDDKRRERVLTEYSYDKILNNLLPPEIRVLGWCPVSPDFSARFSATSRTYRYFFARRTTLDVNAMRSALRMLVGTHDFRNFCRMDVEKVYNFVRTVYHADIRTSRHDPRVAWIEIHGQAFLWHQIRCVAAVLFLVGEGAEAPEVVRELLDVERRPGKPSYRLASDAPLVLHSCDYGNLRMGYSVPNLWNVTTQQQGLEERALIAAARTRNCLASLENANVAVSELLAFAEERNGVRRRKQSKTSSPSSSMAAEAESPTLKFPFGEAQYVSWKDALDWLRDTWDLAPEPSFASKDATYVPLLKRHAGPTYEEKVANLQLSAKRKERYVTNVIKKRKTKEEDAAFYRHMALQGSSTS